MSNEEDLKSQQSKAILKHFTYVLCAILYQRGMYPESYFSTVHEYGLQLMVPLHPDLALYFDKLMGQFDKWIVSDKFGGFHITITTQSGESLEKYCFELSNNPTYPSEADSNASIRQSLHFICSSISWLAPVGKGLSFRIQVVEIDPSQSQPLPAQWGEARATTVPNSVTRSIPEVQIKTKLITAKIHVQKGMPTQPNHKIKTPWQS